MFSFSPHREKKGLEMKGIDVARRTNREIRGMYNFECGRWNRAGRTRNAVSWEIRSASFRGETETVGEGRTVERRKREEREGKRGQRVVEGRGERD